MKPSTTNYRFMTSKPGHYRLRNGEIGRDERTRAEWEQAYEGHIQVSHDGVFDKNCNGCRELKKKAQEGSGER